MLKSIVDLVDCVLSFALFLALIGLALVYLAVGIVIAPLILLYDFIDSRF